ncbi:MAG: GtrA family protein [Syntrophomonadaceae bacterium]|nr:GtrA family protein [Syntrophomonadaceae bacterium]
MSRTGTKTEYQQALALELLEWLAASYPGLAQLVKYGTVSLLALLVDAGLLHFLTEALKVNYLLSASIGFSCGLVVNYTLSIRTVFDKSRYSWPGEFVLYTVIGILGLLLNDLIIFVSVELGAWYMTAKLVSTAIVFFFNFFCRRSLFA